MRANINDLIDRAEDPEKMVKQIIIDMEEQVRVATQALGQAMASEKQALNQLQAAKSSSADWEGKARMALQAGNEALAKQALESKVAADMNVSSFEEGYNTISMQVSKLRDQVSVLRGKLEEARAKQNLLTARAKMAEAQKQAATSIGSVDSSSAFTKLEKMEKKVESMEAEAAAFSEMADSNSYAADQFEDLAKQASVAAEFERLKAELGQ